MLMAKYQRLFANEYQISTKDYVRIYKLFMQNKANFMRFSPENADFTKKQTQFKANKANSKPIKPKTKPIQTQSKPISPTSKFDFLKCLKLQPIMLLSINQIDFQNETETIFGGKTMKNQAKVLIIITIVLM